MASNRHNLFHTLQCDKIYYKATKASRTNQILKDIFDAAEHIKKIPRELVSVPCCTWKCVPTTISGCVDVSEVSGCYLL